MSNPVPKNPGHSVFQRLLNYAKENREDFNLLLSRYAMERFLYRLSISEESDRFILKGASLFLVWKGRNYRATRDADFLALGSPDIEILAQSFRTICALPCPEADGMVYLPDTLKAVAIRDDNEYDGVRITLFGQLNQARIPLQVDIGFGDAVTPAPENIDYPTLLDFPAPQLKAYPKYTLIAEKLEAMIHLGMANSRMKDFFDIWLLSTLFKFDGGTLTEAIRNTFNRRQTVLSEETPFAFTPEFYGDEQKQNQWNAFIRKSNPETQPPHLEETIQTIRKLLDPAINAARTNESFAKEWAPVDGWNP